MKKYILILVFASLLIGKSLGQSYQINAANSGQTISTCKGQIESSIPGQFVGGSNGYLNNESDTLTFCSSSGGQIRVNFYWISLETNFDFLYVYDGPNVSSPLLATLTGDMLYPGFYTSTGSCLTFRFATDAGTTWGGFNALIGCTQTPCNSNPPATDDCASAPTICNFNGYCGNTSGWFTRDNGGIEATIYGGNNVFSCGSIQNNSWLSFVANSATADFQITSSLCSSPSSGIQAIVLSTPDCANFNSVSNCVTQAAPGTDILNAIGLTIGQRYYIMVDGVNGNDCRYDVIAQSGVEVATISSSVNPVCPNTNDTLVASAPGSGLTFNWSPAPISGQGTASAVYSVSSSGTYTCTITGACGVTETPTVSVTALAPTVISINDTTICKGDTASLVVTGTDTYVWAAGITANGVSTAFSVPSSTTSYTVVGTSILSGCKDTALFTVTVNNLPMLSLFNDTICLGETAHIPLSGAAQYSWSNGSSNDTLVVVPISAGTTTFTVTGTVNSCSTDTTVSIIVNTIPTITNPVITNTLCGAANGAILSSVFGGTLPYSYNWVSLPGNTIVGNSANLNLISSGQYQLIVKDSNLCSVSSPVYSVPDSASVIASFSVAPSSGIVPLTVAISNTTTGVNTYSWSFGNSQSSILQSPPNQIFTADGTYTITLIADNGTCRDTAEVLITVVSKSAVDTIPNIFTPNNDGINDVFEFGVTNSKIKYFQIYNRWGVKVYESPNISTLSKLIWDGRTTSGMACSEGTYFYILEATGNDSNNFKLSGTISLVR